MKESIVQMIKYLRQCVDQFAPLTQTARVKMNVGGDKQQDQKCYAAARQIVPQMN